MKRQWERFAKSVAAACVRNTFLEELHSGKFPGSETGDYSDVKIVTPSGEITWNDLSRINDEEMKRLMKEVVNRVFTVLINLEDPEFVESLTRYGDMYTSRWDAPEVVPDFLGRKQ